MFKAKAKSEPPVDGVWDTIDTAPRGSFRTVDGAKGERQVFVKGWVWTMRIRDGHVTQSYWIPDANRWCAYTPEAGPDMWMALAEKVEDHDYAEC
jgi:hypothetical protein